LCCTAACLLQQQQQQLHPQHQQQQGKQPPDVAQVLWHLSLRLLLTAAPGTQLQSASKLADSCVLVLSTAVKQEQGWAGDLVVQACVGVLSDAVAAAGQQLCKAGGSNAGQQVLPDAVARLPVLLSALLQAAACCSSLPEASTASAAAVSRACGMLLWCLQQHASVLQQGLELGAAAQADGSGLVACKVLEALRQLLQEAVGPTGQQQLPGKLLLAQQCAAAVIPQVGVGSVRSHSSPVDTRALQGCVHKLCRPHLLPPELMLWLTASNALTPFRLTAPDAQPVVLPCRWLC
jgi:hypothetical protein